MCRFHIDIEHLDTQLVWLDSDGDGIGDVCDCAPLDATTGADLGMRTLRIAKATPTDANLNWFSFQGDSFRVYRGSILQLGSAFEAACIAEPTVSAWADGDLPAPEDSWIYLVRSVDEICGAGLIRAGSAGRERQVDESGACSP